MLHHLAPKLYQSPVLQQNILQTQDALVPVNRWVQSFWQLDIPQGKFSYRSIPDNCVDWIINVEQPEDNFIVTPFSVPIVFEMQGKVSYFGIRFHLSGYQGLMLSPLGEWASSELDTQTILPNHIWYAALESIEKGVDFQQRCKLISPMILQEAQSVNIDERLLNYIQYCHKNTASSFDLSDKQCVSFGLSARQLRRLTHLHLGLSPRNFSRVMRLQKTLHIMHATSHTNMWGEYYYDQAHFIREFKSLTGLTPLKFQRMSALYNTD